MSEASAPVPQAPTPDRIVLYDGVCGFCDWGVQTLLDLDRAGVLHYAALQSDTAAQLRKKYPEIPEDIDTIVYIVDGVAHLRSRAILRICADLPMPWRVLSIGRIVPAILADPLYNLVAKNRYRIWGTLESCRIPKPEETARFLP